MYIYKEDEKITLTASEGRIIDECLRILAKKSSSDSNAGVYAAQAGKWLETFKEGTVNSSSHDSLFQKKKRE